MFPTFNNRAGNIGHPVLRLRFSLSHLIYKVYTCLTPGAGGVVGTVKEKRKCCWINVHRVCGERPSLHLLASFHLLLSERKHPALLLLMRRRSHGCFLCGHTTKEQDVTVTLLHLSSTCGGGGVHRRWRGRCSWRRGGASPDYVVCRGGVPHVTCLVHLNRSQTEVRTEIRSGGRVVSVQSRSVITRKAAHRLRSPALYQAVTGTDSAVVLNIFPSSAGVCQ